MTGIDGRNNVGSSEAIRYLFSPNSSSLEWEEELDFLDDLILLLTEEDFCLYYPCVIAHFFHDSLAHLPFLGTKRDLFPTLDP